MQKISDNNESLLLGLLFKSSNKSFHQFNAINIPVVLEKILNHPGMLSINIIPNNKIKSHGNNVFNIANISPLGQFKLVITYIFIPNCIKKVVIKNEMSLKLDRIMESLI